MCPTLLCGQWWGWCVTSDKCDKVPLKQHADNFEATSFWWHKTFLLNIQNLVVKQTTCTNAPKWKNHWDNVELSPFISLQWPLLRILVCFASVILLNCFTKHDPILTCGNKQRQNSKQFQMCKCHLATSDVPDASFLSKHAVRGDPWEMLHLSCSWFKSCSDH